MTITEYLPQNKALCSVQNLVLDNEKPGKTVSRLAHNSVHQMSATQLSDKSMIGML